VTALTQLMLALPRMAVLTIMRGSIVLSLVVVLQACRSPSPSTPPPTPVLSAVLVAGPRIQFARPQGPNFEALPSSAVILRLTSAWPLDGERVEVILSPFVGGTSTGPLAWVRTDDVTRKQALANAGYIETVVDGFGYSVIVTGPPPFRNGGGYTIAVRTSAGGTAAAPTTFSTPLSVGIVPQVQRVLPSAVFFDCPERNGSAGNWYNNCKNSSSIVDREVVLEGRVHGPGSNCLGTNDPICVEDWHYDFSPDPDFIEQMYGPQGAFEALGDHRLSSATVVGNPPDPAGAIPFADRSAANGQSVGVTINSFVHPGNVSLADASVVEVKGDLNAWHQNDQPTPGCILDFCRHWIGRGSPPDVSWVGLVAAAYPAGYPADAADNAFWPYDPRLLTPAGATLGPEEYVRMAGTLWQDADHGGENRWLSRRAGLGGYMEIHPVDWIVRAKEPPVPKTIRMVEDINFTAQDKTVAKTLEPSTQQSGSQLRCRELIDGRFTDMQLLRQHSAVVGASSVDVQTILAPNARFKAVYLLWWESGGSPNPQCRP
jgi:hypothetical protein